MSSVQTSPDIAQTAASPRWQAVAERRWFVAAVYLTLTALALYPIFSVTVPPLVDYPNHLARMHILATWDSDPALQKNYVVQWSLHPNMAMDLIVPLLAKVMPIYMAGKIFIAMTLLSVLGGTLALHRVVVGRIGLWPVLTFLVLYNHVFFWGFLNYLFTAGLAMASFAGWIALRERRAWQRIALFSAVSFCLYVGHLFGLFVYGLLVAGYELWRAWPRRPSLTGWLGELSPAAIQFVVPALLFLTWAIDNRSTEKAMTGFGTVFDRFSTLISPVNFGHLQLDLPILIFLACIWLLCRSDAQVRLSRQLTLPLLFVTAVALIMPVYLSGVWGTHLRLPVIIACLLIAGTRFPEKSSRVMPLLLAATVFLCFVRTVSVASDWRDWDASVAELRQTAAEIDRGARLLPVQDDSAIGEGRSANYRMKFWHLPALTVIERSVFLPTLFTGHTSVGASAENMAVDTPVGNPVSPKLLEEGRDPATSRFPAGGTIERYIRAYWVNWPETFDVLLTMRTGLDPESADDRGAGVSFDVERVK